MAVTLLRTPQAEKEYLLDDPDSRIALSEIVSALSFALDLTEDAVPGHALRSCLLGMRIGHTIGLCNAQLSDLYYALLLKDIGCSSNSARMCQILGGDDRKAKRDVKTVDWTRPTLAGIRLAWNNALPNADLPHRIKRIAWLGVTQNKHNAEMIGLRCERGANIVRKIGLSEQCADTIHSLDEHWNGSGYPDRSRGDSIPRLSRILGIAQHLDVFASDRGRQTAIDTLQKRSGSWFDPDLVSAAVSLHRAGTLWIGCATPTERVRVMELEPGTVKTLAPEQVDQLCEAFADVVDAKSSYTYRHSLGVTEVADAIALRLGLPSATRWLIHRAALLHDLGKLRVPNSILDKPGNLDESEWAIMREHPELSQQILERIPRFAAIARIAGRHHEKLDGTGYPHKLTAADLSIEDRVVALADVYGALAEDRPYRKAVPTEKIVEYLNRHVPQKLDPDCFAALMSFIDDTQPSVPPPGEGEADQPPNPSAEEVQFCISKVTGKLVQL